MQEFAPYQKYKFSGFDYFGDIPEHWKILPIKFSLDMPITDGPHSTPNFYPDGIPFLSAEAVKNDRLDFDRKRGFISQEDHELFSKKYKPKYGDVYMVKSGATTGAVARVQTDEEFNIWSPLAVLRPHPEKSITDFIFFVLKSKPFFYSVEQSWSYGTQQNIGMGVISNIRMALPPIEEQQTIARFLDFKTAQIDALIAKKKALLDKLAEKRTALISHAVTKGLDPTVPMKDSGVEWLGEIPEHWEPKKIKYFTQILRGKFSHRPRNDPRFYDGDYPFIQTGDVARAIKFITSYSQTLNEDGLKVSREFPAGTLVMTIAANIGDMAILNFDACFPDSIVGFVPQDNVNLDYLFYMFTAMRQQLLTTAVLNTQLNLNIERIADQFGACPPIVEQIEIAKYLESMELKLAEQALSISNAVDRLQEYRSALITNAVTGKIDVRDWEAA